MPVPPASVMKNLWKTSYPLPTTAEADKYATTLFKEIERAWKEWHSGIKFGGLTVTGAGAGAWKGTGAGGSVNAPKFKCKVFVFYKQTKQQVKFQNTLYSTLEEVFKNYASSVTFKTIDYIGSSTAGQNPGIFNAEVTPVPLLAVASVTKISGIADKWKKLLTKPDYDLTHPQCAANMMVNAVSVAVEKSFAQWATTTTIKGSKVSGVASAGPGIGQGSSTFDGTLT